MNTKRDELVERLEGFVLSFALSYHIAKTERRVAPPEEIERLIDELPRSGREVALGGVRSVIAREEELGAIIVLDG